MDRSTDAFISCFGLSFGRIIRIGTRSLGNLIPAPRRTISRLRALRCYGWFFVYGQGVFQGFEMVRGFQNFNRLWGVNRSDLTPLPQRHLILVQKRPMF